MFFIKELKLLWINHTHVIIFYDITVCYATLLEPYITDWSDKASPPVGIKLWLTVNLWHYKAEHTLLYQFLSHFHIKRVGSQSLDSCAITLLALSYHFFNFWSWLITKHLMKCITLSKQAGWNELLLFLKVEFKGRVSHSLLRNWRTKECLWDWTKMGLGLCKSLFSQTAVCSQGCVRTSTSIWKFIYIT